MEKKEIVKFDLMHRDNIIAKIELNMVRKESNVDLVDVQRGRLYLNRDSSFADVMEFLQIRSIVERSNYHLLLESIRLNRGSSLFDILEKTNGVKNGDKIWIISAIRRFSISKLLSGLSH